MSSNSKLNFETFYIMPFTRKHSVIMWSYELNDSDILSVETYSKLGIKFKSSFDPGLHINVIYCTSSMVPGLMKRLAHDFKLGINIFKNYFFLACPSDFRVQCCFLESTYIR